MLGFYNLIANVIRFELQRDGEVRRFILHHDPQLLSNQVTQLLSERGWAGESDMDSVVSSLHIKSRILRRKLSDQGEGFQHLKHSLRRDQAINLLNETRLTIGEVGQRVGFTEPAAFSRAFRQWTGISPYGYRQGLSRRAKFGVTTGI